SCENISDPPASTIVHLYHASPIAAPAGYGSWLKDLDVLQVKVTRTFDADTGVACSDGGERRPPTRKSSPGARNDRPSLAVSHFHDQGLDALPAALVA